MGGLFWLSSQPVLTPPIDVEFSDKIAHALAYFGLCLVARLPAGTMVRRKGWAILLAFVIAAGYGALDEWHQSLTPNRVPDINDWYADIGGAFVAVVVLVWAERIIRGSRAKTP